MIFGFQDQIFQDKYSSRRKSENLLIFAAKKSNHALCGINLERKGGGRINPVSYARCALRVVAYSIQVVSSIRQVN